VPQLERKSLLKDLDIPSVRDRSPDPNAGPRLNVVKFKLEGIVEYPELGIHKTDIEQLIEGIRYDLMDEYKVQDSGFTEKELEEVADLLGKIEEETEGRHVSDLEVQKMVWLVREQRSNRGVTLGQIETVADRITQFYRERGFVLAKAYIPKQEVRDGIVTLTLLLGKLGEVRVHSNELYERDKIAAIFDDALTLPVTSQVIEEKLYLLNDYPGLTITGFFEPGNQVGDTRLNLDVRNESKYKSNLRLDNHGSEQTGEYRLYGEVFWNNPLGNADQLHIAALYATNPDNTDYYKLGYSTRLLSPRFTLSAAVSENDFVLGPGNSETVDILELFGKTIVQELSGNYRFKRSRTHSYYGEVSYQKIESQLRIGAFNDNGDSGLDDVVNNISLAFSFDVLNEKSKILHQGTMKLIAGDFVKGAEPGQDENYSIFNADYSLLTFLELPLFDTTTRLIYRAALQYTSSSLSSINQFTLGGPTRVRAYDSNQFSADDAVFTAVDWVFNAPGLFNFSLGGLNFKNIAHPFLFLDASWGEARSLVTGEKDTTGELYGMGVGLQFSHQGKFQGNLQLAFPLKEHFNSDIEVAKDDFRLVFDFQYGF
jgi:hemolysin activation/secretion protein